MARSGWFGCLLHVPVGPWFYKLVFARRLVYFENSIPTLFTGDLTNEDKVLVWLKDQMESDEIEEVTDEMLNMLINQNQQLAVVFCKLSLTYTTHLSTTNLPFRRMGKKYYFLSTIHVLVIVLMRPRLISFGSLAQMFNSLFAKI